MKIQSIKIGLLKTNSGQIDGLPKNPRFIKDNKYQLLLNSIKEDPEMLELREVIVYPFKDTFVVIGGNMRLKCLQELKYTDVICKVLPIETPIEKLKAFLIKDNVSFGSNDWDLLANEWEVEQLESWGMDVWQPEEIDFDNINSNEDRTKPDNSKQTLCPNCGTNIII